MYQTLKHLTQKPALFEQSTAPFWADPHISKSMLDFHLAPDIEAASRKHAFIDRSVEWIASQVPPGSHPQLLDLGCGPGIYGERFAKTGYEVTGVDISERSVNYANEQARAAGSNAQYVVQDYRTLSYENAFDLATMIYCDFGVLSDSDGERVLQNAHRALKPNGTLILDVFTPAFYSNWNADITCEFQESGFWRPTPHAIVKSTQDYRDRTTFVTQYAVIEETDTLEIYRIWEQVFTVETLSARLNKCGFSIEGIYGDVTGIPYTETSEMIGVVAQKNSNV